MAAQKKAPRQNAVQEALDWYNGSRSTNSTQLESARTLLKSSAKYRVMTGNLNRKYISGETYEQNRSTVSEDGFIESGPFKKRRILKIDQAYNGDGTHFHTHDPLSGRSPGDGIGIRLLRGLDKTSDDDMGRLQNHYITSLTHELAHAHNIVNGSGNALDVEDYNKAIKAFINDEIKARQQERAILKQVLTTINRTKKRDKLLNEVRERLSGHVGSIDTTASVVQRDFVDGDEMITYLEKGVLDILMQKEAKWEGLTHEDVQDHNKYVRRLKFIAPLEEFLTIEFPVLLTRDPKSKSVLGRFGGYVELRLIKRVINERWQQWAANGKNPKEKERNLQEHAKAFFPESITYSSL